MKKFEIAKHYVSRSEKESIGRKDLHNAAWVEFSNGTKIEIDEGMETRNCRLYASSLRNGIFCWDEDTAQYVHYLYLCKYDMGNLTRVVWEVENDFR